MPILLLIPAREYLLPRIFGRKNLAALDPAPFEDEEGRPLTQHPVSQEKREDVEEGKTAQSMLPIPAIAQQSRT